MIDYNPQKIKTSGQAIYGVFTLFVVFMRLDLIDNYIHNQFVMYEVWEILIYLLYPSGVDSYENGLSGAMIPLNDEKINQLDIFCNPRYHPKNRLLFLWKLCFSTEFIFSLLRYSLKFGNRKSDYQYLKMIVLNLYDSFEIFHKKWHLDKYDDLKSNEPKQNQLHKHLQIILQSLFCVCDFYIVRIDGLDNIYTVADLIKCYRANKIAVPGLNEHDVNNITLSKNDAFIDLLPSNESEVDSMYNIMTYNRNDDEILDCFSHSTFDRMFDRGPDADENVFIFDEVTNPRKFFHSLWKIGKLL